MNYNHHIFTFFLIAASVCNAMDGQVYDLECKLKVIGEITVVKSPLKVRCLEGDRAVIWGGPMDTSVVDFKKNEIIEKLSFFEYDSYSTVNIFPTKKNMPFFSDHMDFLENVQTKLKGPYIKEYPFMPSITFSPHEKAVYFCYRN